MNKVSFFIAFLLIIVIGCKNTGLDYDKIDFEVRKRSISYGIENPRLERKSEINLPLYLYYEDQINNYNKDLLSTYKLLDTLREHKDIWLDTIRIRQVQRIKNKDEYARYQDTPEREYNTVVQQRSRDAQRYVEILDSIKNLYDNVSKKRIYYEFLYEISGKPTWDDKEIVLEARVRVDEGSNVFECLFLDSHLYENTIN